MKNAKPRKKSHFSIYLTVLFITSLTASYYLNHLPQEILLTYLTMSVITYITYALDKSKAKRGTWRTPESTLHLLALFGGWPGAALAQQMLRHKSRKTEFRVTFYITVITNTAALSWLMSAHGEAFVSLFS